MIPVKIAGVAIVTAMVFYPWVAFAYVGPGAGLTLIGSLIGVVVAVVLAIGAVLLWPLRRLIRKFKSDKQNIDEQNIDKLQGGKS